jgi:hypothetical protein
MVLIQFNLSEIIDDTISPILELAAQSAINTSLLVIRDKWQQEAQNKLNSTRTDYLMGLSFDSIKYPYQEDPLSGAVVLQGKFPNMLEKGFGPFDMKPGFAGSLKKISTKDGGWYLTIPMRHSTPGSFMYGSPMPVDLYTEAKKLPNWGSLSVKGGLKTSWTGYQHKNNIYDSLTRIIKQNANGRGSSQYMTFRRVGSGSDPMSWWHPGFHGVNIAESLGSYAEITFKKALEANLGQVFKAN